MNQSGGKMIATGSKTCIFNPNIPCSKSKTRDKSKISKIYVSKKDKLTDELKINKMIQSLENSDQWAVLFTDTCKHPLIINKHINMIKISYRVLINLILQKMNLINIER